MPCPEIAQLEKFAAGQCDDETSAEIQTHVASCTMCNEQLSDISDNVRFIDRLRWGLAQDDVCGNEPTAAPETIGSYRIIREIGRGGMGVVYEALQRDPPRAVALKVLNVVHARDSYYTQLFNRETRALARLDHPGIACIYESGCAGDGRAYFAMELVRGESIITFARHKQLDRDARLRLFCQVCDAVALAHQRGVIHRDLKPSNILISQNEKPKVLDFGLARILEDDSDDRSIVTQVGRVLGTLPYMSPEQARGNSHELDTRSDVYSLGVILYQLFTDHLPYPIEPTNVPAAVRAICDETPRRPVLFNPQCRGDLEIIVLNALEKDPARRYQSALALREDIQRLLGNEPILARAPSTIYQLQKLASRNKPLVGALFALLAVLVAGIVLAKWQAVRASAAERLAKSRFADASREATKFKAVNEFLQDMLSSISPEQSPGQLNVTVRDVLDQTAAELDAGALESQPEIEASVRTTLGNTYRALGHYAAAEPLLRRAVAIGRSLHPDGHEDLAYSIHKLARLLCDAGQYDEAEQLSRESLAMRRALLGEMHPDVAKSLNNLGVLLWQRGRLDEAKAMLRDVLTRTREIYGPRHVEVATAMNNLASMLRSVETAETFDEAESLLRSSLELDRELRGEDHPNITTTMNNLAVLLMDKRQPAQAEVVLRDVIELQRRLLGDEHPQVALSLGNLALAVKRQNRYDEAAQIYGDALAMNHKLLGNEHPAVAKVAFNLGRLYLDNGHPADAVGHFQEARDIYRQKLGESSRAYIESTYRLGQALMALKRYEEAEAMFADAIQKTRTESLPESRVARFQTRHGQCLMALDRDDNARRVLTEACETLERSVGSQHMHTQEAREALSLLPKLSNN